MALWTDDSRQLLISCIRNRPIIWDKSYMGESNYRTLKTASFRDVTDEMNSCFQINVKFTCEDIRSQWKNLKDTFVRKLRWVHEGKYVEDDLKEPTWKFYRQLSFLDEKEMKRLGDADEHTYELAPAPVTSGIQSRQSLLPSSSSMMNSISYEPASSEDQMLQMFNQPQVLPNSSQQHGIEQQMGACTSTTDKDTYSPPHGSSSGVEEDEEEQPERKKIFRRPTVQMHQQMPIMHSSMGGQDEFDHFGALVAANLRRMCSEQGRQVATRVQRKLSDVLFSDE